METLVATVLIVVLFMIASLVLNGIARSNAKRNTVAIESRLQKLIYLAENDKVSFPYTEVFQNWNISGETTIKDEIVNTQFIATHGTTKKSLSKQLQYAN
ncbi:hypothetical protein [Spongiivirga citrea]|nr:hypothetical protein [Spongiivirga citrea]